MRMAQGAPYSAVCVLYPFFCRVFLRSCCALRQALCSVWSCAWWGRLHRPKRAVIRCLRMTSGRKLLIAVPSPPRVTIPVLRSRGGQVQTSMLRMVAGLVVVIALAVLIAWVIRRSGLHRRLPGQRGDHLEVLESLSLGPKRGVSLLRVGGQFVLVGHNEQSMAALGTFAELQASPPSSQPSSQQGEAVAGMQQIAQPTGQSAQAVQPAPQARMLKDGDSFEASSELPSQAAHEQPTTTDSVDDFRQRLNRLLGGRSS